MDKGATWKCSHCCYSFCTERGLERHLKIHQIRKNRLDKLARLRQENSTEPEPPDQDQTNHNANCRDKPADNALKKYANDKDKRSSTSTSSSKKSLQGDNDDNDDNNGNNDNGISGAGGDGGGGVVDAIKVTETLTESEIIERITRIRRHFWSCKFCFKKCPTQKEYQTHLKVHSGTTKPYSCQICEKKFVKVRRLRSHLEMVHFKYKCSNCTMAFPTAKILKSHKLSHEDK